MKISLVIFLFLTNNLLCQEINYLEGYFISYKIDGLLSYDHLEGEELLFFISKDTSKNNTSRLISFLHSDSIMYKIYHDWHRKRIYFDFLSKANFYYDIRNLEYSDSVFSALQNVPYEENIDKVDDYIRENTIITNRFEKRTLPPEKTPNRRLPFKYRISIRLFKAQLFVTSHKVNLESKFNHAFKDFIWDDENKFYRYDYKTTIDTVGVLLGIKIN